MQHWLNQLNENTAAFQQHFGALTKEDLNWKPNSTSWSIGQNIDHLIVINSTYFPILEALDRGTYKTPFLAKFGFLAKFFGTFILQSSSPDRSKKIKTFPIWEPTTSNIDKDILNQFERHQDQLKEAILASEQWIRQKVVIGSPANRMIVYSLSDAYDIIVAHEQRHLEQAKEVLEQLNLHQS